MVKVKICGITNLKDALSAVSLGADALGFIFYKKSPRYIKPEKAKNIISKIPAFINTIGVFVDEKESTVKKIASYCDLDVLQFHGDETSSYCKRFKGYRIIKAFRIKDKVDIKTISKYKVDAYLLDTYKIDTPGGTGKTFNWNLVKKIKGLRTAIILSGGLNHRNVKKAVKITSPYAVDASSGLERRVGRKDYKLLELFFHAIDKNRS